MSTQHDDTNRIKLFATNARGNKAPSHSGSITIHPDLLEENEDGTLTVAITAWLHEEGHIFGVCESYSEKQEAYKKFKAEKESGTKKKTFTKGKK